MDARSRPCSYSHCCRSHSHRPPSLPTFTSGVNIYAAAFLIPVGVMFYTAHGGLKATYIAAWAHVAVIYIALNT